MCGGHQQRPETARRWLGVTAFGLGLLAPVAAWAQDEAQACERSDFGEDDPEEHDPEEHDPEEHDPEEGDPEEQHPEEGDPEEQHPEEHDPEPAAPEPPTVRGGTVEVRGTSPSASQAAHRAPEAAFVVRVDDPGLSPAATVADVLDDVPGLTVRRLGAELDPSFVRIRGSTARQVAVFVDGIPLNAYGSAAIDLSELDLRSFDRVEVFRGFAPSHLGGFAIGGAVNLVTDPASAPAPGFDGGFGSWLTRRLSAGGGKASRWAAGDASVRARVSYAGTRGDYPHFSHNGTLYNLSDDRTLRRGNNERDQVNGSTTLRLRSGRLTVTALERAVWSDGGVPGAYHAVTDETSHGVLDQTLFGRAELALSSRASLQAGVGHRYRWERYQDLLGEVGVGRQDDRHHFHTVLADLGAALRPLPWLTVSPSARLQVQTHDQVDLLPRRREDGPRVRVASEFAADARAQLWAERVDLRGTVGLVVLDQRFFGLAPFADSPLVADGPEVRLAPLPGFAAAFRPWPWLTLRGAVAKGFRPPTMTELFGDRGSVVGNTALRPEQALQADASVRLRGEAPWGGASGELGGFVRDTEDLIVFVPNSQRTAVPINLGRTRVEGIEGFVGGHLAGHLAGQVAVSYTPGTILEHERGLQGNALPGLPRWQVDAQLSAFWDPWVRVTWRFSYTSGTFDSPSNFFEQAPRPLHDLSLRVQPHPRAPWFAVDLRNVLDTTVATQFRNPLEPKDDDRAVVPLQDFRGQPLPGRSVMVTAGWSWDPPPEPAPSRAPEG